MKNNKKGFTLIELLAVIVILAIIALIAVPQVLKILNQARRSAAEDSAYGILKSAESYVATYMIDNHGDWNASLEFVCDGSTCETKPTESGVKPVILDFKGSKPKEGKVVLDSEGQATITEDLLINGFYCKQTGDTVTCSTTKSAATPSEGE